MSMPPSDLTGPELFAALSVMPRPFDVVDFPRRNADGMPVGRVAIRILNQAEQHKVAAEAERHTRKAFGTDIAKASEVRRGYDDIYTNEAAVQLLASAVRDANDQTKAAFPNPEAIRNYLTPDEIGVLMVCYFEVQRKFGPIVGGMTGEEAEAWLRRLEDGARGAPFSSLSREALTDLLVYLVHQRLSSTTATSSSGTPADASTPETLPLASE